MGAGAEPVVAPGAQAAPLGLLLARRWTLALDGLANAERNH
jgi:hypothetical protein